MKRLMPIVFTTLSCVGSSSAEAPPEPPRNPPAPTSSAPDDEPQPAEDGAEAASADDAAPPPSSPQADVQSVLEVLAENPGLLDDLDPGGLSNPPPPGQGDLVLGEGGVVGGGSRAVENLEKNGLYNPPPQRPEVDPSLPQAKVAVERPTSETLDIDVIHRNARRYLNQVRYCYELELRKYPTMRGELVLRVTIDGGKAVSAELVSSEGVSSNVKNCTLAKSKRWRWPDDFTGTYEQRYRFEPAEG